MQNLCQFRCHTKAHLTSVNERMTGLALEHHLSCLGVLAVAEVDRLSSPSSVSQESLHDWKMNQSS